MKLGEALLCRSDLEKSLNQLSTRIRRNLVVQEGDKPSEDPQKLLSQYKDELRQLMELIAAINHSNERTKFEGATLTDALARRDILRRTVCSLREFATVATVDGRMITRSEIKRQPTLDASELQKQTDRYSKQLRELEVHLQEINWTVDL